MQILINKTAYQIPFDLSNISVGQFIDYYNAFGRDLDKAAEEILNKKYGDDDLALLNKEVDQQNHIDLEAISWFSFWSKIPVKDLKSYRGVQNVLTQYRIMKFQLMRQEEEAQHYPMHFSWQEQEWEIQNFEVDPSSEMTFNEVITSKEVIRQLGTLAAGKWEAMPYLCAVFLRKKAEPFDDEFILEGNDRLKLMKELPMIHALQVGFFLSISISIWRKISQSLENQEQEEIVSPN